MARPPQDTAAKSDKDPGSERVTMTAAELTEMVNRAAAVAVANALKPREHKVEDRSHLPTMDEAVAQAAATLEDGTAPIAIETQTGWYVHPMAHANTDQVEAHLAQKAKKARAKKAKAAEDDDA